MGAKDKRSSKKSDKKTVDELKNSLWVSITKSRIGADSLFTDKPSELATSYRTAESKLL